MPKDLYFYSPSGNTLNFSYDAAFGLLNFQESKTSISHFHDMESFELSKFNIFARKVFNLPDIYAEHKLK